MSFSSILAIVWIPRIHRIPREPLRGALAIFACCFLWSCESRSSVEVASEEGILIMGNSGEPKGLDPHIVSGVLESNVIRSLFEGLVEAHPSKDGVALPGVATKWYPVNEEQPDEWVFELRKDARWSDGKPLTAQDFLFSFRRLLTPALASDYSFMLYYIRDAEPYHKSSALTSFRATTPTLARNGGTRSKKLISGQTKRQRKVRLISSDWTN